MVHAFDDPLVIAGRTFRSRLVVGTGKYPSNTVMADAHLASGAEMVVGNPTATSASLFKIVDAEQPPLRFFVGSEGLPVARTTYAERLAGGDFAYGGEDGR